MNVLDLFSGIGGFSLGLERAGMRTVAFCEINRYCRGILRKHWPGVTIYTDVRRVTAARLQADGIVPNVICGGFPCQDISLAGEGAGLDGERSGLWYEYLRIIKEHPDAWIIIENVSALRHRGLGTVLRQLAALGRDAEWHCIPAAAVGAPHLRDRVWIVAHPACQPGRPGLCDSEPSEQRRDQSSNSGGDVPDSGCERLQDRHEVGDGGSPPSPIVTRSAIDRVYAEARAQQWGAEPAVGRVADGVPDRVDRLGALGNAVVPQLPELIGRAIMSVQNPT